MGGVHWLALFGLILGAWGALYAMALPAELREGAAIYGDGFLQGLCIVTPDAAGFGRITVMWALMSAAMMAPTALPAFATYEDLGHSAETRLGALVAGYLGVWIGFSLLAAAAQMALFRAGLLTPLGDSRSGLLSAGLLAVAGAYQFSPMKEACLSRCRRPLAFFIAHWEAGPLRNGVRLGLVCLGCCWALMALAFVGGVMNLAFMGLATVIMVLEKLPDLGRYLTHPLGVVLLAASAWVLLTTI
ncbi:DUF2182 domain-containing protein [Roseovarius sp. D22-M7]|uniref:DUF2182 domain-containing protein n=1 Tax=Roseovarius sp. D22-M7 TaxID=3127116 RepID=UPI0030103C75